MRRNSFLPGTLLCGLLCAAGLAGAAGHTVPAAAPKPTTAKAKATATKPKPAAAKPKPKLNQLMELDWRELLPETDRAHYSASAPPPIHGPLGEGGPPAAQKMTTTVNAELAGQLVRLPGFVVPIGTPHKGMISEFFLVPYIGACIHVPPPPPNQMVYVTSAGGIAADAIHEAYWVTGKIRVENRTTPLGTAAYALSAGKVELYQY